MTLSDAAYLARRLFSVVLWHLHEWEEKTDYEVGGVFIESRFCGITTCQRWEIRNPLNLEWEEHKTGGPWL